MNRIAINRFFTRLRAIAWMATTAIVLTGCSATNGVSIVEDQQTGYFAAEEYARDVSMGDLTVVVRGSAFGMDQRTLSDLVVRNMQGADWGPHARFTTASSPTTARTFSYVMMLNGPLNIGGAALCARPSQPLSAGPSLPPGEIRLVAAICRYNKIATSISGRAVGVVGPNDPKVHALIAGAVQDLTRPNQPRIDQDRGNNNTFDFHP
jgi:hypothetical protein